MRAWRAGLLSLVAWMASAAPAQEAVLEPSAASLCLRGVSGPLTTPEYPFELLKLGRGGRVLVELTFARPDARPAVQVLEHEGEQDFVEAVERHVRQLRVPCLTSDAAPARLRQDYRFRPDSHEVGVTDSDPDQQRQERMAACLMHTSGASRPEYPRQALSRGVQGRVLARLRFDASDRPPQVRMYARDNAELLVDALRRFAGGYRVPCYEGTAPLQLTLVYHFVVSGDGGYGFRSVTLPQFIGSMRGIRQQRVEFDLDKMGCPFDVTLTYWQPQFRNDVTAVGKPDARRTQLLEWLRDADLDLSRSHLDAIFGDRVSFTVPCGRIDLKPKE